MIKEQILEVSMEIFLSYGFKSVSMEDLAKRLGISKKTLYQNVESKGQLIESMIANHLEIERVEVQKILDQKLEPIEEMLAIGEYKLRILKVLSPTARYELQKYYPKLFKRINNFQFQRMFEIVTENLKRGIKLGFYRTDLDTTLISKMYIGTFAFFIEKDDFFEIENFDKLFSSHLVYHLHGIVHPSHLDKIKELK